MSLVDPGRGPIAMVKDTIDVAGVPTRCGTLALSAAPPATADAEVVTLLRAAGWRITAKTKLHELAFGTTGLNAREGTPVNPRWPDLVPGGSSSGSAVAVAAGLAPLTLGTDTGGSVRVPAACCGVFGHKPTFGLVSRRGVAPPTTSLDCVGPLAKDIDTLIAAMTALAPGFRVPTLTGPIRVGVLDVQVAPAVKHRVGDALGTWAQHSSVVLRSVRCESFVQAHSAGLSVINIETWQACKGLVATGLVGLDIARRLQAASATTQDQLRAAEAVRNKFRREIDALLVGCDVVALPTLPELPPRVASAADTVAAVAMTRLVRPFNLSGHPAISLPLHSPAEGPVALQLVSARGADGLLCGVANDAARSLGLSISAPFTGEYLC